MLQPRPAVLIGFLTLTVFMRLIPYVLFQFGMNIDPETTVYPWNFSPLLAICLFGGAHFKDRRWAYAIPLGAYLIGDLGIGVLSGRLDWAFYPNQPIVYGSIALCVLLGLLLLRSNRSFPAVAGAGLGAACLFFVVSNLGVWFCGDGVRYPHNLPGLIECYYQAIPFFRNTLISMAVFCPLLFSKFALEWRPLPQLQPEPAASLR